TTFSYDVEGRITTVEEPGHAEPRTHVYDGEYHLLEEISPEGHSTTYRVNPLKFCTFVPSKTWCLL
ncbi:MAG: hypothetical protein KKB90_09840, partial [Actinobacteria bacterium]|nr:hypothetical protein [Actinomycetota bacterium]MCG2819741.1 hypothetical protein [Actinomycetes bacterium]MBU4219245.1 hypothetical protein [Actinomycetota bacterium]MBU4359529.1 hypothetical protein [Actinomycetota bacterium]MBU4390819.1 hypothetical protein [Actinomycetota bacterium]